LPIADIRGPHIRRLYGKLHAQGYKPGTICVVHAIVHGSLREAKAMGLIGRNHADGIRLPQRNRDVTDHAFTKQDLDRLLPAMVGHRHEWLWRTMLETGLRFGEPQHCAGRRSTSNAVASRWSPAIAARSPGHVQHPEVAAEPTYRPAE
jgi:integrase